MFSSIKCLLILLQRNIGILAIIDEESWFPKGTDFSLATKLHHGPGIFVIVVVKKNY
jgi:myosin heavy subunit